jgi:hypothetical protein
MPMIQEIGQAPLALRIPALAEGIRAIRAQRESLDREEAALLEQLRQAETALVGSPAAAEGVKPSGLLQAPPASPPAPPAAKAP